MITNSIVTVATILHNDASIVESYVRETLDIMASACEKYELLLVDNGSDDQTHQIIKRLQIELVNIRLVSLSKQYEDEYARVAAMDHSIGDFVVLMDVICDPPQMIPTLLQEMEGYDLVIGERSHRENYSLGSRLMSKWFYRISKWLTGYKIDPNQSDFVLLSRKMVNSLIQIRDRSRYFKYLKLEVGYRRKIIKYDPINRGGRKRKRAVIHSISFAIDMIVTNSDKLLRSAAMLGFMISSINFIYVFYIILIAMFKKNVAEGWVTTSLVNAVMFSILFAILSIISIYISSILKETKKGPLYYVTDESNSSVIYKHIDKKNIV